MYIHVHVFLTFVLIAHAHAQAGCLRSIYANAAQRRKNQLTDDVNIASSSTPSGSEDEVVLRPSPHASLSLSVV